MTNIYDELKWRGLFHQDTAGTEAFFRAQPSLIVYAGFDPTAESLHVGNLIPLLTLKRFADKGHKVIGLLGGATALIGDPSGRSTERNLSTIEEVHARSQKIISQLKHFLPESSILNNFDWIQPLNLIEFLRDIGKHFSISEMLHRDSISTRLSQGISFTEFSYMLLQAYDFYFLAKEHGCQVQVGGSDQWGNITSGIELTKKKLGKTVHGLTLPLITSSNGQKLGKTVDGAIWLDPDKTTPYAFYQYWLNTDDHDAIKFCRLFTALSQEHLADVEIAAKSTPESRISQHLLAEQLTCLVHGKKASEEASLASKALFENGDLSTLPIDSWQMLMKTLPHAVCTSAINLPEAMIAVGLVKSKGEASRDIASGGLSLNGEKVKDPKQTVSPHYHHRFALIRKGKKSYACLEFSSQP